MDLMVVRDLRVWRWRANPARQNQPTLYAKDRNAEDQQDQEDHHEDIEQKPSDVG